MRLDWIAAGEQLPAAGEVVLLYRATRPRSPVLAVLQPGDPDAQGDVYTRDRWHTASPYPGEAPWQWIDPRDQWARIPAPPPAARTAPPPPVTQPTLWGAA